MSRYKEILKLKKYCDEIGIISRLETFLDGYAIIFKKGDVVQHRASMGVNSGCVEFGYTGYKRIDFRATNYEKAKDFILKHKDILNKMAVRKK